MPKVIRAYTGSSFVNREVISRLPTSISIRFSPAFNENGDLIIAISSPKYSGIVSEARTKKEAYENVHDAILTYFDVPRACAKAIKFEVVEMKRDSPTTLLQRFAIKQLTHA